MSYRFESYYLDDPIQAGRALDLFLPETITRDLALFFVHGGGWTGGGRANYHAIMRGFNARGYVCASADYRLAGESIHLHEQLTDLRHAYDCFTGLLLERGLPLNIVTHGSSAGAHLAALISLAAPGACGEPLAHAGCEPRHDWVRPRGMVLQAAPARFDPWEDIFPHIWSAMQKAVGAPYAAHADLYRKFAPIEHVDAAAPPLFYMHAENEHMFPLRYLEDFQRRMEAQGRRCVLKTYTNAEHGFFYDLTRRQQREAFADMLGFLDTLN